MGHGPTVNRDSWHGGGELVDTKYQGKLWKGDTGGWRQKSVTGIQTASSPIKTVLGPVQWAVQGPIFLLPPVIGLHPP